QRSSGQGRGGRGPLLRRVQPPEPAGLPGPLRLEPAQPQLRGTGDQVSTLLATAHLHGPHVDFAGLSPLIALLGGATIVLLVGLLGPRWVRAHVVPALTLVALAAALGLTIWQWGQEKSIVSGAIRIDD